MTRTPSHWQSRPAETQSRRRLGPRLPGRATRSRTPTVRVGGRDSEDRPGARTESDPRPRMVCRIARARPARAGGRLSDLGQWNHRDASLRVSRVVPC